MGAIASLGCAPLRLFEQMGVACGDDARPAAHSGSPSVAYATLWQRLGWALTCTLGEQRFLRRAHRRLLNSQAFMLHVVLVGKPTTSSGSADVWLRRVPEDILRRIHVLSLRA